MLKVNCVPALLTTEYQGYMELHGAIMQDEDVGGYNVHTTSIRMLSTLAYVSNKGSHIVSADYLSMN